MRRFFAAVLCSSLPLVAGSPVNAGPSRTLEYTVLATSSGFARRATVTIDFLGGSAERVMNVDVDEVGEQGTQRDAQVGIEPSGALLAESTPSLTSEEEAICSLMALESEDMAGVDVGDHWERQGPVPGGRNHTRFAVLGMTGDGLVRIAVTRDLVRDDGSVARWNGTLLYDAENAVPSTITLNGNVRGEDDLTGGRDVAMTIRLVHDTFKHY